jgi:hypothetical protein
MPGTEGTEGRRAGAKVVCATYHIVVSDEVLKRKGGGEANLGLEGIGGDNLEKL